MKRSPTITALLLSSVTLVASWPDSAWAHDPDGQAMARAENQRVSRITSNEEGSALRRALMEISAAQNQDRREAATETAVEKREESRSASLLRFEVLAAFNRERNDESHDGPPAMNAQARLAVQQIVAEARQSQQILAHERLVALQALREAQRQANGQGSLREALNSIRSFAANNADTAYYAP